MLNGAWKKYTVRNETPNYKLPTRWINKFEISLRGNVNRVACFQSIFIAMKIFYVCNSFFTVCPQQRHNGSSPQTTQRNCLLCAFGWLAGWLREKPAVLINNGPRQGKMEKWVQEGLGAGSWERTHLRLPGRYERCRN